MKLICSTLFLTILFSITLSAQDEKKAIIKMLETETEAWANVDYEKWASCWVHSDIAQLATTQPNATFLIEGWEQIDDYFRSFFETGVKLEINFLKEEIKIDLGKDMAYVSFIEKEKFKSNFSITMRQTRVVKKTKEGWKILASNVIFESEIKNPAPFKSPPNY